MYGIEALMRRTTPVEDEGVKRHSLYKTRGGAYVAVFGSRKFGMDTMFLHAGTSNLNVSPGARFVVDEAGRYDAPHKHPLDLMTRIPYDALDAL
jgi:hypothetical protein